MQTLEEQAMTLAEVDSYRPVNEYDAASGRSEWVIQYQEWYQIKTAEAPIEYILGTHGWRDMA